MTLNDGDYIVHIVDYNDTCIRGATVIDSTGFATIYINARLSACQQRKTMLHELKHILYDDFYNDDSIEIVRARVSAASNEMTVFPCFG